MRRRCRAVGRYPADEFSRAGGRHRARQLHQVAVRRPRRRLTCGFARIAHRQLEPVDVGWFSHEDPFEMDIHSFRYANDARRFWGGTPSIAPFVCAAASLRHIHALGVDRIHAHNRRLIQAFRDALSPAWRARLPAWPIGGTLCIPLGRRVRGGDQRSQRARRAVRQPRRRDSTCRFMPAMPRTTPCTVARAWQGDR